MTGRECDEDVLSNFARWNNTEYEGRYSLSLCARLWLQTLSLIKSSQQEGIDVLEI